PGARRAGRRARSAGRRVHGPRGPERGRIPRGPACRARRIARAADRLPGRALRRAVSGARAESARARPGHPAHADLRAPPRGVDDVRGRHPRRGPEVAARPLRAHPTRTGRSRGRGARGDRLPEAGPRRALRAATGVDRGADRPLGGAAVARGQADHRPAREDHLGARVPSRVAAGPVALAAPVVAASPARVRADEPMGGGGADRGPARRVTGLRGGRAGDGGARLRRSPPSPLARDAALPRRDRAPRDRERSPIPPGLRPLDREHPRGPPPSPRRRERHLTPENAMITTANITVARDGVVATVTLNRPDRRNSLSDEMLADLGAAFAELRDDRSIRVVIVTGAPPVFSAGADAGHAKAATAEERRRLFLSRKSRFRPLFERANPTLENLEQATIAAVNGHAVGGGWGLALACDFRLAAAEAQFWIPEVDLGVPLGIGTTTRFVRLVGPARAKEIIMGCARYSAAEAQAWGLVHRVVPGVGRVKAAGGCAERLAAKPSRPLAEVKARINAIARIGIPEVNAMTEGFLDRE